jgi:hypothetical protein
MRFYLGTHIPAWVERVDVPWFVSVTRLLDRKSPLVGRNWVMDSGGFTQIAKYGRYTISESDYHRAIAMHKPGAAFCQDWMCEPSMLQRTGLSVQEHQKRTLSSYLSLSGECPEVRPVLQGWSSKDYARHVQMYQQAGVDMSQLFGVGSVCSRNGSEEVIVNILRLVNRECPGIRLHGFGLKSTALTNGHVVSMLESADSMAWSSRGRRTKLCNWGCPSRSCGNCLEFALLWRRKVLAGINRHEKRLFLPEVCP